MDDCLIGISNVILEAIEQVKELVNSNEITEDVREEIQECITSLGRIISSYDDEDYDEEDDDEFTDDYEDSDDDDDEDNEDEDDKFEQKLLDNYDFLDNISDIIDILAGFSDILIHLSVNGDNFDELTKMFYIYIVSISSLFKSYYNVLDKECTNILSNFILQDDEAVIIYDSDNNEDDDNDDKRKMLNQINSISSLMAYIDEIIVPLETILSKLSFVFYKKINKAMPTTFTLSSAKEIK